MRVYWRAIVFLVAGAVVLSLASRISILQDAILWTVMVYLIVGSMTGGVRRVMSRFTSKNIHYQRSGLGYSWYVLTMWILRNALGLKPRQNLSGKDDQ